MNDSIDVSRISFRAAFADDDGRVRTPKSEFNLGLGPCGKVATRLAYTLTDGCLVVLQECEGGETKVFTYPLDQLQGRIEATAAD